MLTPAAQQVWATGQGSQEQADAGTQEAINTGQQVRQTFGKEMDGTWRVDQMSEETKQALLTQEERDALFMAEKNATPRILSQAEYIKTYVEGMKNGSHEKGASSDYWNYVQPIDDYDAWTNTGQTGGVPTQVGWEFDEEGALEDAKERYDGQYQTFKEYMNIPLGEEEGPSRVPNARAYVTGEDQKGLGVREMPSYGPLVYDHNTKNPTAVQWFHDIYNAQRTPGSNVIVQFGDKSSAFTDVSSPDAEAMLKIFYGHLGSGFTEAQVTKMPRAQITYAPSLGGKDAKGDYAGYIIHFDPSYLQNLRSTKEDRNKLIPEGEWLDNNITVFVPKGIDFNNYRPENQQISTVNLTIKEKGVDEFEIYPGGKRKIYQNSEGQYMVQYTTMSYDSKTGNFVTDNIYQPQVVSAQEGNRNMVASERQLDGAAFTLDNRLSALAQYNLDAQAKHKLETLGK